MRRGPIGMLSKMGGRMISFYADDLVELLLGDFLGETVGELQKIEEKTGKAVSTAEAQIYAESLLKNLSEYQSEEAFVNMRWNNPAALKGKAGKPGLKAPS